MINDIPRVTVQAFGKCIFEWLKSLTKLSGDCRSKVLQVTSLQRMRNGIRKTPTGVLQTLRNSSISGKPLMGMKSPLDTSWICPLLIMKTQRLLQTLKWNGLFMKKISTPRDVSWSMFVIMLTRRKTRTGSRVTANCPNNRWFPWGLQ